MEADIAKRDVQQREDRNLIVGKIEKIDKLKGKIKEKEEELGIETKSKRKGKNKEKSEDSDKDSNATPKTKEEKHFDAIEAVLNLPTYWVPSTSLVIPLNEDDILVKYCQRIDVCLQHTVEYGIMLKHRTPWPIAFSYFSTLLFISG